MNKFYESAFNIVKDAIDKQFDGDLTRASQKFDISYQTLYSWFHGTRNPSLTSLSPILNLLGAKITLPEDEHTKDVCFVNAHVLPVHEGVEPPRAEDYIAVPLVGEVGAGVGYLPQDEITGWFMVHKNLEAIRYRRNLIAVEIAKGSTSMQPTLNPGDIVLVDRQDRDISKPGKIMLVIDPMDSSGMIKRVSVKPEKNDFQITFYSDNTQQWPPMVYSFNNDFDHEWDKVVAGRVIWAWSDMREK